MASDPDTPANVDRSFANLYDSAMFERIPPLRRFDEELDAPAPVMSEIRRRSSPYVVGDANDSAERRADEVADRGMLTLQAAPSRLPSTAAAPVGPGSRIQRSANGSRVGLRGGPVDESLSSELDGAIGRGRRFEPNVQRSIRRATGHDVSDVNVHTDARADRGPGWRIQRSANGSQVGLRGGPVDESLSSELDGAIGRGRCFEPDVQRSIRRATGHDVSNVKVHTDARADRLARSMQASAFTVDRNVFFASGQYRPDTDDGMHTVLHESAHLAEGAGRVQRSTIRRKIAVTVEELDGTFKHHTGLRGLTKSLSSDEVPKIREALKSYHASKPGSQEQLKALRSLHTLGGEWILKRDKVGRPDRNSPDEKRWDVIDSIRNQAGVEFGKLEAGNMAMEAGAKGKGEKGAFTALQHPDAYTSTQPYNDRTRMTRDTGHSTNFATAQNTRGELVKKGQLQALPSWYDEKLNAGMNSLTEAEFASIHAYTGSDYSYINKNVGGWGKGPMNAPTTMKMPDKKGTARVGQTLSWSQEDHAPGPGDARLSPKELAAKERNYKSYTDAATAKNNRETYEEAGLHAGFIMQAFQKLPVWMGTTYRGSAFDIDKLGLATASSVKANDFWSSSENVAQAKEFCKNGANDASKLAFMCTIDVIDGRDVARMSNSPDELEILLRPSLYRVGKRECLTRGQDDARIAKEFGTVFKLFPNIDQFWLVNLKQSIVTWS